MRSGRRGGRKAPASSTARMTTRSRRVQVLGAARTARGVVAVAVEEDGGAGHAREGRSAERISLMKLEGPLRSRWRVTMARPLRQVVSTVNTMTPMSRGSQAPED